MVRQPKAHSVGLGVDAHGGPVIDPTTNVIALTDAANLRQDDLRKAEARRVDELRTAESRRVDEQAALRARYEEKLSVAEAKRIDAIRAVDVNAVAVASQRQADQATVLANQVVQSAEALRALVATTAAAQQQASQQITGALSDRITQLEKSSYEGAGKQAVADPAMTQLVNEVKALRGTSAQGSKNLVGYISIGLSILLGLILLADKFGK